MFSNTNSLPIGLIESLVISSALGWLRQTPDDDAESVAARGIGYIVFYSFFGNMVRWSYGQMLLKVDLDQPERERDEVPVFSRDYVGDSQAGETSRLLRSEEEEEEEEHAVQGSSLIHRLAKYAALKRLVTFVWRKLVVTHTFLSQVLSPPLLGALVGLVIALDPFLRSVLVEPGSFLNSTVFIGIKRCGDASVPLLLVCLGAQLSTLLTNDPTPPQQDTEAHAHHYPSYRGLLAFIVVSRLVILPFLTVVQVWLTYTWFPIAQDPMFIVTIMLIGSCPTAINLMVVCQTEGMFEVPMGRSLLYQYVGSLFTLASWCVVFLWSVQQAK
jgi:predicted permease